MVTQREEKDKRKSRRENLGKFFYDLAKTTFAVMVLGNVATVFIGDADPVIMSALIILGVVLTSILASIADRTLKD